jgi:ADP-ribose pyrophosphatase YjhB (NUDIX family)
MPHSYKVFIDNCPFVIADHGPIDEENWNVKMDIESIKILLSNFQENPSIYHPIWIVSPKVDEDFENVFSEYKWIEAAGGLVKYNDRFLFIKRNGFWDIPKGKLELDEAPDLAAIREIEEECGIMATLNDQPFIITWHTYFHKNKKVLKKTYWYAHELIGSDEVTVQTEEGLTDAAWLSHDEWDQIRMNTFQSIIEVMDAYPLI